jgi:signal transduction histidine kinase
MRLGLRGRILMLVLVALAPPTVVALAVALEERNEAREHAQQDLLATAKLVRGDVERVVNGTAPFLTAVAQNLAKRPDRRSCERLLVLVPRSTDRYSAVGVAEPNGSIRCGATRMGLAKPMDEVDVAGAGWFRKAQTSGGFVLGNLGRDPLTGTRALMTATPLPGPAHAPRSVMFAALDVRSIADATAVKDVPRGTSFLVLDSRGTIVARQPPLPGSVGRRVPEDPLVRTVLEGHEGTAEITGLDGVTRMQGFSPVGGAAGQELFVAAGRASESVFADPDADLRRFLLLALLGLVLALVLAFVATKVLLQRWTSAVADAARRFGAGDLSARAPVPRGLGDLTDVATALNAAAEDIARRQEEQAGLMAELVAVEEETRRRVAADIHDDTAQAVSAAALRIDTLVGEIADPAAREAAANARQALVEANKRLRRLLFELRPPALDRAGLGAALEQYLTYGFGDDGLSWRVDDRLAPEPRRETRAILYRVAVEALTNVRKHADAHTIEVVLERRGGGVAVRIRDDGRGFDLPAPDAAAEPGHIGIVSMRERAEAAGGRLELRSAPGSGTLVDFWMPDPNGAPPSPRPRGA